MLLLRNLSVAKTSTCFFFFAAIKVSCNGFCGVTNKVNDTAWTVEEQYFNSTVSIADKGRLLNNSNTIYKNVFA